jgi:Putative peptidoglycan binding domain
MNAAVSRDETRAGGTPAAGQEFAGFVRRPRRRRALIAGGVAVVLAAGGGTAAGAEGVFGTVHAATGAADNAAPTSLATITQGPLSAQVQAAATLGYADQYTVLNQSRGTYTALPRAGQVISRGNVLYQVSGSPVVLLYGSVPAYRTLREGMTGTDVRQLNANLVALGYATSPELDPTSDYFSSETAYALEHYQTHLGIGETGELRLGQAVFLPGAVRVVSVSAALGGPAGPGQQAMQATSTTRQVSIALDASEQSYVSVGDKVTITLPDNATTPGTVSSVGTVATTPPSTTGSSTPTIAVDITPADPSATGNLDQAPVQVSITTATVPNALAVPVDSLLALPDGGYAVEVAAPGNVRRLLPVTLGLFDDAAGTVQVSGSGLRAGEQVVVPAS